MDTITTPALDPKALKEQGFFQQSDKEHWAFRISCAGGMLSTAQMEHALAIATSYGCGQVHLTTRQQIEVPGIAGANVPRVAAFAADHGLRAFRAGPRVRSVVACVGKPVCSFGRINTASLAQELHARFVGQDLPAKCKLAVTGCRHNCAKVEAHDIGVRGVRGGCDLFFGGSFGKTIRIGATLIPPVPDTAAVVQVIAAALDYYAANAQAGERMGALLDRQGPDGLRAALTAVVGR